ncbi:phage tail tube protein [Gordonia sp. WA4-43]|uniref:phage tail tube protein n=1 Tax=Gordonia sp. WA4-43 TaxID=2878678 RepID=UPI001CFB917E|nr:Ig-like domain-containing protein [Gordonia sp. WA4-43]UCZ89065.1 Ig-like domain-containing protein [Gordonia sp. WA4-43]
MAILNHPDTSALDATLARHWAVQVCKSTSDPWLFVQGLTGVSPNMGEKSRQDAGDMHGGNYGAQIATEANWSLELTLQRKLDNGAPDPGVELLRSLQGELGGDELVWVRFWRTDELPDSYQGRAGVTFANAAGDKSSLTGATVTLTGYQGYTKPPKPGTTPAATSISLSPSAATIDVGGMVQLIVKDNNGDIRTREAEFESSGAAVTVSSSGLVTGVSEDIETITATLGALTDTCSVTVGDGTP